MQLATWGQVLPMVIAVIVALYVPGLVIVYAAKSSSWLRMLSRKSDVFKSSAQSIPDSSGALSDDSREVANNSRVVPNTRAVSNNAYALTVKPHTLEYLALAPLPSIVIAGASGVLAYVVHIRWGWGVYVLSCVIVCAVVVLCRVCARVIHGRAIRGREAQVVCGAQDSRAGYMTEASYVDRAAHGITYRTAQANSNRNGNSNSISISKGNALAVSQLTHKSHTLRTLSLVSLVSLALAAISVTVRLIQASPSPDQVTQNYDTVFHDNVVANTILTGQASSLHALTPIREVYPIAFHEFAALAAMLPQLLRGLGLPVPVDWSYTVPAAMNATWLVFAALVWSISILYLVRVVVGNTLVGNAIAPLLAVSVSGGPFLLLNWGTLYPMFAGQAILPVLLALTWKWCVGSREYIPGAIGDTHNSVDTQNAVITQDSADSQHATGAHNSVDSNSPTSIAGTQALWRLHRSAWTGLLWIIVAMGAVSFAHFRVNMTFLLVAIPVALVWLKDFAVMLRARYGRAAFHTAIWAFAAIVIAVCGVVIAYFANRFIVHQGRPISDHLNGPPALPTDSMPQAILRAITGSTRDAANHDIGIDWLLVLLLSVAIIAIAAVLISLVQQTASSSQLQSHDVRILAKRGAIMLAAFALLCFVIVACSGTHADWAKVVTALWYKDQRRLYGAWGMVAIPVICAGLSIVQTLWSERRSASASSAHSDQSTYSNHDAHAVGNSVSECTFIKAIPTAIAIVLTCCICVASPVMRGIEAATAETFRFARNGQDVPMVSTDEYLLLKRIGQHVPADQMVVSDPWNGSGLMLAIGDRRPYYAHLFMAWDADHQYIGERLQDMNRDPQVCEVLKRNNLQWYVDMGGAFSDPMQEQHRVFLGLKAVPQGMQLVDSQGNAKLYRITGCK